MEKNNKIHTFEDLISWQYAITLAKDMYALTRNGAFSRDFSLRDQIRRATVSISANIAEGFERRTSKEYAHFLNIAKGSAGEVRSLLRVAFEVGYLEISEYEVLRLKAMTLSRIIAAQMKTVRQRNISTVQKSVPDV